MLTIVQASHQQHFDDVGNLAREYLVWANGQLMKLYGIELDIESAHRDDVSSRAKYLPPKGRQLLASVDGASAGCICLKQLDAVTGEVKRLYVRPAHRGHGIGRELLQRLIQEARAIGYQRLVLDSGQFQKSSQAVFRRAGFSDIAPHAGSEIPEPYRRHWVFMELLLTG